MMMPPLQMRTPLPHMGMQALLPPPRFGMPPPQMGMPPTPHVDELQQQVAALQQQLSHLEGALGSMGHTAVGREARIAELEGRLQSSSQQASTTPADAPASQQVEHQQLLQAQQAWEPQAMALGVPSWAPPGSFHTSAIAPQGSALSLSFAPHASPGAPSAFHAQQLASKCGARAGRARREGNTSFVRAARVVPPTPIPLHASATHAALLAAHPNLQLRAPSSGAGGARSSAARALGEEPSAEETSEEQREEELEAALEAFFLLEERVQATEDDFRQARRPYAVTAPRLRRPHAAHRPPPPLPSHTADPHPLPRSPAAAPPAPLPSRCRHPLRPRRRHPSP